MGMGAMREVAAAKWALLCRAPSSGREGGAVRSEDIPERPRAAASCHGGLKYGTCQVLVVCIHAFCVRIRFVRGHRRDRSQPCSTAAASQMQIAARQGVRLYFTE